MSSLSVAFHTLGCKLNQLETEAIAQAFSVEGFSVVPWGAAADLYVVNTCTVTSMAEQKARREIRKVLRERPSSCVVATGCYAQLDPEALENVASELDAALGGGEGGAVFDRKRIVVVSGDLKSALLDLPAYIGDAACSPSRLLETLRAWAGGKPAGADPFRFDANDFAFHSRASLKIQDGCDNACSYCRVRLARGKSVSLAPGDALRRLRELEERGYAEAVLTGINLSRYRGPDGVDFSDLLRLLLAGTERIALRVSSTEPECVDERFAEAAAHPRVRPHFHLSVQSGSDAVLRRMRRRYLSERVVRAAELLRAAKSDPFLACDIIAGFPGETEDDFRATVALCGGIGFSWIHAFPFSPRPGTEAAALPDRVPERESRARVELLTVLAKTGRAAYVARWLGRTAEAVAEHARIPTDTSVPALSENYLKLLVDKGSGTAVVSPGQALRCRIAAVYEGKDDFDARAELLEKFD